MQLLLAGAALAGASMTPGRAQTTDRPIAFTNVSVVDGRSGGLQRDAVVVVNGARIGAVGARDRVTLPPGAHEIGEATGLDGSVRCGGAHVARRIESGGACRRQSVGDITNAQNVRAIVINGRHLDRIALDRLLAAARTAPGR